jgi:purine-nucleoside phosphorylase
MIDFDYKYKETIEFVQKKIFTKPDLAIILGSGLGDFANSFDGSIKISTSDIPSYPHSTVVGHKGEITLVNYAGKNVILFSGRIHFYEGYKLSHCLLPIHLIKKLACDKLILTNAAGGINKNFIPGDLMLASSFNGFGIKKEFAELFGVVSDSAINNFRNLPAKSLNEKIKSAAEKENLKIKEGVYWFAKGPSYETPSEVRMIKIYGGDAVGMSTVHEAFYSALLGIQTSSISCITNFASGISKQKLSHSEVTETASRIKSKFESLLKAIIKSL